MTTRRYQVPLNRHQATLLPACVEDYVSEHNPVRAIDAFVNSLDLLDLGFTHAQPVFGAGQPPFNPSGLLKLYLYGYLQGVRSSRKLECETHRNLEAMWLMEGLQPSYKTIANFRANNAAGLKAANRDFVLLCRELSLFGGETVAVDGSFLNADASKESIYTEERLKKQLELLDKKIADYQEALSQQDAADDKANKGSLIEDGQLEEKLALLKQKQMEKKALQQQLEDSGDKQVSTVDPDARILHKRGQSVAGYNVQIVVDDQHKLIVVEEVTQDGNDTQLLAPMLIKAKDVLDSDNLSGIADAGYYESNQIKTCEDEGITVHVAIPDRSQKAVKEGRFPREQFEYDAEQDCYHCPQGNQLTPCGKPHLKNEKWHTRYQSQASECNACPLREQCLGEKSKVKQIQRWEHEAVIERHKERMEHNPQIMRKRGATVEHPFGTIKHRAGMNHFLMRTLKKCQGEFSLMVLSYNFTRVLKICGADFLRDYCAQRHGNGSKSGQYA
jgi:transposase